MTNNMTRDSNGLFTNENENENETTYEAPHFGQSPTSWWESYTNKSIYGDALFEALVDDSENVSLAAPGGSMPLIEALKLQHEATMAGVREARVANMIAIATHKEYFNKGTVATAYGEINDYINGRSQDASVDFLTEFVNGLPAFKK